MSGTLGDARLALEALLATSTRRSCWPQARQRLERPTPRGALGLALRGIYRQRHGRERRPAGDFGHILQSNLAGACIRTDETIKLIAAGAFPSSARGQFDQKFLHQCALAGVTTYELLFTAPPSTAPQRRCCAK